MNAEKIVNWPGQAAEGIEQGIVRGEGENGYLLHGSSGVIVAGVAFSCLVKPMTSDKVMYIRTSDGSAYILAILDRPTGPDAVVSFPGDVIVESSTGKVTLTAASGIDLATGSSVSLTSSELNLSSMKGRVNLLDVEATGNHFTGRIGQIQLIAESVDLIAQCASQRLKRCYRWVEEIEHITAGQLFQKARTLFSVRARQSTISAEADVKIDGQRVHIG